MESPKAGAREYETIKAKKRRTTRLANSLVHDHTTYVVTIVFATTRVVSCLSVRIQQHTIASPPGLEAPKLSCPRSNTSFATNTNNPTIGVTTALQSWSRFCATGSRNEPIEKTGPATQTANPAPWVRPLKQASIVTGEAPDPYRDSRDTARKDRPEKSYASVYPGQQAAILPPWSPPRTKDAMSANEEPSNPTDNPDPNPVNETVEKILSEGKQVRARIREMVTGSVKDQEFSAANLGNTAQKVMGAAYHRVGEMVESAVPRDSEGALRDVVYGIGDAFGSAARSAGKAFESASKHGRAFATEDVKRVTRELGKMGTTLVTSIKDAGQSAVGHTAQVARGTVDHATQAAEEIKPTVEKALAAAAQHPIEIARDTAKAGVDVTRQMAGSLFSVLGDLMRKAAEVVSDATKTDEDKNTKE